MQTQLFVATNPPHREVDQHAVASLLGLEVQATSLKIGFPAPEVLAATDPDPARDFAERMHDTGLSVTLFDGKDLAVLPWPEVASSFALRPEGLEAQVNQSMVTVPWDTPVTAVYWKPPPDFASPVVPVGVLKALSGPDLTEAVQFQAGIDLFYSELGEVRRISIVRGVTDFGGLDGLGAGSPTEQLELMLSELDRRFDLPTIDTRLENVRPRQRFAMGDDTFDMDMRKLFSYGTLLLRQALMAVSPELGGLTQYELGCRVAYVLNRARQTG